MKTKKRVFIVTHPYMTAIGKRCYYWELCDERQSVIIASSKNYTSQHGAIKACKRYAAKNGIKIG